MAWSGPVAPLTLAQTGQLFRRRILNAINSKLSAAQTASWFGVAEIGHSRLWCLAPGTMLDTSRGPIAVQHLRHTDRLIDETGQTMLVRHLCSATIRHDPAHDRRRSHPVLIRPGAIGEGIPDRLLLLPAAARVNIPDFGFAEIADLANGVTILLAEANAAAKIWHGVVGDGGSRLLIGGLSVEGAVMRLDDNEGAKLHAIADPPSDPAPAFELPAQARLAACRQTMADRALLAGHDRIADPGLLLRVGGDVVAPECSGPWCRFALPGGALARVTLLSRHAVPATLIGNDEKRRLGVAVCRIMAGRRPIPLAHWSLETGWHVPEGSWRWTDGAATLRLPPGAVELAFELANTLPAYPLA